MNRKLSNIIKFPFFSAEWARQIYKKFEKRANRHNWFEILNRMAKIIAVHGNKRESFEWLDIGAGECHSTIQQLNTIQKAIGRKMILDIDVDVLEPSPYSLAQCLLRLHKIRKDIVFRNFFKAGWYEVTLPFRYDYISTIHSAYYFTKTKKNFHTVLRKIYSKLKKGGIAQLLILPSYSSFYKVIGKNYFGDWVYAENIFHILKKMGYKPKSQEFSMKLNINDIFSDKKALYEFWLFMMNKKSGKFSSKERNRFLQVLEEIKFRHNSCWVIEMNDWLIWFKK